MNTIHSRVASLLLIGLVATTTSFADDDAPKARGRKVISNAAEETRYREMWALIIGVNYEERNLTNTRDKRALPQLDNAEQDATAIHKLLTTRYGYKADNVQLLTGKDASYAAISREIGKLRDEEIVKVDDSVLIFFAGHGDRLDGELRDRAAIFPYDVELSNGKPLNNEIRLYSDLFGKLRQSPARHKLVVLDSCYSGEILKAGFHSTSEIDDRSSMKLFQRPVFSAMASCRAFQVASDGNAVHSPFTAALLKGLRHLPARDAALHRDGIWTRRLFAYLHPEVRSQSDEQEPQFGILDGDGEFRFFPDGDFSEFRPTLDEQKLLQATVTSTEGNWWFDETPWFIPGLRQHVLKETIPDRSSTATALLSRDKLRDITREVVAKGSKAAASSPRSSDAGGAAKTTPNERVATEAKLFALRCRHAKLLMDAEGTPRFEATLKQLVTDLESDQFLPILEATDLHLLAIARHAASDRELSATRYQEAIAKYRGGAAKVLPAEDRAMLALCRADFGQYLFDVESAPRDAARAFREADREFGNEAPTPFRIYVLCREADAWLRLNRWAKVDECLRQAGNLAERFDSGHHLAAFVYRRLAWARMIQWEIGKAEHWFTKSNEVLGQSFSGRSEPTADTTGAKDNENAADTPPSIEVDSADSRFVIDDEFENWNSYDAKIAYLHNLHGLAMVQRFKGKPAYAAGKYRWLAGQVENTLTYLKRSTKNAESDSETKLYSRLINTLERLGDCNLFGDPALRDPSEAIDDYRRALARCHRVSGGSTSRTRLQLLYKLALALSLPPATDAAETQDTELALVTCAEADKLYAEMFGVNDVDGEAKATPNGMILALGELTTKMVALTHLTSGGEETDDQQLQAAIVELRNTIHAFRDANGPHLHRDQLEICLFASKVLLDRGLKTDRFHLNEDAELLLSFCRLALAPYQHPTDRDATTSQRGETTAYLRPYYDTVMRAKLRSAPRQVKDLLEIQSEATQGRYYVKPEKAAPTLALYVLDDQCYLLVDLPRGTSRCVSLADDYDVSEIREASTTADAPLVLPREVTKQLVAWKETQSNPAVIPVNCHWHDPVRRIGTHDTRLPRPSTDNRVVSTLDAVEERFPLKLPTGFALNQAIRDPELPRGAATRDATKQGASGLNREIGTE